MRVPRPPPALINDKASAEWARSVTEIGARWSSWTPSFYSSGSPDIAMDSQVVNLAIGIPIGSVCFVCLDATFIVPAARNPSSVLKFNLPLPIQAVGSTKQHAFVSMTGFDSIGLLWRETCEAYAQDTDLYVTPFKQMFRNAVTPNRIRGNFFYVFTRFR